MDEKVMDEKVLMQHQVCDDFGTVHSIAADEVIKDPLTGATSFWCEGKRVAEFIKYQWIKNKPETEQTESE